MTTTYVHKAPDGTLHPVAEDQHECPKCLSKLALDLSADEQRCRSCGAWCSTSRDVWIAKRLALGLPPVLPVLDWRDPRLRLVAAEVTPERLKSVEFYNRTRALAYTMGHHKALGLAATQLGWRERVFVLRDDSLEAGGFTVAVNPMVVIGFGGHADAPEGCLSFPGAWETMRAPLKVRAMWTDISGNPVDTILEGDIARALVHEVEHLNGKLFTDRMGGLQRRLFMGRVRAAKKRGDRCRD